jgi:predicted phosphate transport protein (TIGR00153 family)
MKTTKHLIGERLLTTWIWASKKIEKEMLSKCLEHCLKVSSVVECLASLLRAIGEGRFDSAATIFTEVMVTERKADEMKRSLIYDLSRATLLPLDRDYMMRLILRLDDVADYSKAAARRLLMAVKIGVQFDKEYVAKLLSMVLKLREAMDLVDRALREIVESPQKALNTADAIERIEEEVDDVRTSLLEYVLLKCDEKGPKWCALAKEIVDEVENSVDRCEEVADMIRYISVSLASL